MVVERRKRNRQRLIKIRTLMAVQLHVINAALLNIAMMTTSFVKIRFSVVKREVINGVMSPAVKKEAFWMMPSSFVRNAH